MDMNASDSGSRVTRSLRKRLTSIDSDISSRPGTPLSTKLTSITEISYSPSRTTRATRRNSVSSTTTPVKTPAKRGVSSLFFAENSEVSLTARTTRRGSVSANENVEAHQQPASKITSINILHEIVLSDEKQTINTRSKSKSPTNSFLGATTPSKTTSKRRVSSSVVAENLQSLMSTESAGNNEDEKQLQVDENQKIITGNNLLKSYSPKKSKNPTDDKNNETEVLNIKIHSLRKRKPGPKSKTRDSDNFKDMSDIEINILEGESEDGNNKPINMAVVVLNDQNSTQMFQVEKDFHEHKEYDLKPITLPSISNEISINANELPTENIFLDTEATNTDFQTNEKSLAVIDENLSKIVSQETKNDFHLQDKEIFEQNLNDHIEQNQEEIVEIQNNAEIKDRIEDKLEDSKTISNHNENNNYNNSSITSEYCKIQDNKKCLLTSESFSNVKKKSFCSSKVNIENDEFLKNCETPEKKNTPEVLSISTITSYPNIMKKVDFTSSPSNDRVIKNVYPKTPTSTKSRPWLCLKDDSNILENEDIGMIEDNELETTTNNKSFHATEIAQSPVKVNVKQDIKIVTDAEKEVTSKISSNYSETGPLKENQLNESTISKSENYSNRVFNQSELNLDCDSSFKANQVENLHQNVVLTNENDCDDNADADAEFQPKIAFSSDDEDFQKDKIYGDKMKVDSEKTPNDLESIPIYEYNTLKDSTDENSKSCNNPNSIDRSFKWIYPSVKGNTVEGLKLDVVVNNDHDFDGNPDAVAQNKKYTHNSAPSSENEEFQEEDIEDDRYERKSDFIDDEAMEVDEYESGDSMGSEERREIEQNEIPIDGESIASEATDDSQGEYAEEEDSANSFIVSDEENLVSSKSDYEEDLNEQSTEKIKKIYTRIQRSTDSSSSSGEEIEEQKVDNCFKNESDKMKSSAHKFCENINLDSSKLSESAVGNADFSKVDEGGDESPIMKRTTTQGTPTENNDKDEELTSLSGENSINSECQLENISVTSSDADKKQKNISLYLQNDHKSGSVLNNSFANVEEQKEKVERQCSFTSGVSLKDVELETAFSVAKPNVNELNLISSTVNQEFEDKGIACVDNIRHMPIPLGNPLIRTRRQSLALPANPDMEICSSSFVGTINKKIDRKSSSILPDIDFKPSLSFIENSELQKNEKNQITAKRKRLSKSFCGSTEAHDHSFIDIDTHHIHKRSKLVDENSLEGSEDESAENINSSKIFTKISSTPHEKGIKNDSYNKRILNRCEEILETANRAKLESKIRNKNKTRISKNKRKNISVISSSEGASSGGRIVKCALMETKRKDKTKSAISQAFIAADAILTKPKASSLNKKNLVDKRLAANVNENVRRISPIKKNSCVKEMTQQKGKIQKVYATSAGNFIEFPQTPEKKKKQIKYIQLPTGKVSVEPITPKKRLVSAFRESPLSPYEKVAFKLNKMNSLVNEKSISTLLKTGKRKRCLDESLKYSTLPNVQWSQSGNFTEEVISDRNDSKKTKKRQVEKKQSMAYQNFKENALSRPDINRCTKRELLLVKERKQVLWNIK